ncbi:TetR/AcrR family transcriptional regulator [Bifidobacterium cuniculi]|uniref:Acrr-type transcriptional regulator n=1 Tax=Bifidobacterium cuniculi TaxID=1688 RepID=A0A087AJM0_9BIFI|nr:TetR/AcrR family transcriptional regulator [Bifidobacterium cuniculi]KFI58970.1 acrr-type transcriptional regulator [Bifidobacterium cuniculi]
MPRPRHDSEVLPAKQRLENSFWSLLQDEDFTKITVTEVVRDAQVNRNSFYYHFSGLPELADSAIMHEVERTPDLGWTHDGTDPIMGWRHYVTYVLADPEQRQRIERLSMLTGQHGCTDLTDSLHDFMLLNLMSLADLDMQTATTKQRLIVDFLVSGMIGILRNWPQLADTLTPQDLMDDDMAILMVGLNLSLTNDTAMPYWDTVFTMGEVPGRSR